MVNSNVMKAVGEALQAHNVQPRDGERMGDSVARVLHISDAEAEIWLEALSEGCTIEEANSRAGIVSSTENEPLLVTLARSIGALAGKIAG